MTLAPGLARSTRRRTLGKGWTPPLRSGPSWPLSSGRTSRWATSSTSPRSRIQSRRSSGRPAMMSMRRGGIGVGAAGVVEDDRRLARRRLEVDGAHRDLEPVAAFDVDLAAAANRAGGDFKLGACGDVGHLETPLPPPVSAGSGSMGRGRCPPLSRANAAPQGSHALRPVRARRLAARSLLPFFRRNRAVLVGVDAVEGGERGSVELRGADLAVLVRVELLQGDWRTFAPCAALPPTGTPPG